MSILADRHPLGFLCNAADASTTSLQSKGHHTDSDKEKGILLCRFPCTIDYLWWLCMALSVKGISMLLRSMTIQDVAKLLHLSWDVVKEMHLKHLERRYRRPSLRGVESIGIDEFAARRGLVYKTIVVDLISGRILHTGDGKGADALDEFWKRVRQEGVSMRYVATDMSSAFAKSVRENVPDPSMSSTSFTSSN